MDELVKYFFLYILLINCLSVSAQSLPNRYQEDVFATWTETSEVQFSTNVPQPVPGGGFYEWITGYPLNVDEFETTDENLFMDIFQPVGDTLSQRPLMIICFGGGFITGSKDHWSIRLLAQQLAKRGFVTATIDYRLGMNLFDADLSNRAVYRGIQDGRSAVRFFRADAAGDNEYKIDPNQIFIGGHSAGAFIATHNAYLDKETERPLSTYVWTQETTDDCVDLGCLDCAGDNQGFSGHANAIFSLSGALGFTDFIESASDPRMVMFHSEDDGTVPYTNGQPFSDLLWAVVGDDLPDVYGSSDMADQADAVGLPYEFYSYTNRGHGVHENDPDLYDDIVPGIEEWFYMDRLKPQNISLNGDTIICTDATITDYAATQISNGYYDWLISGASAYNGAVVTNEIEISWDQMAAQASISVVPYSKWRARGDSIHLSISYNDPSSIHWTDLTGNWLDATNWNLNRIPTACDDVELPTNSQLYEVTVPSDVLSEIRSLIVYPDATLKLQPGAIIKIREENTDGI